MADVRKVVEQTRMALELKHAEMSSIHQKEPSTKENR
jgi:hypothetical protein